MTPTLEDDLALAHRLADAARALSLSYFRRELQQWAKHDGSLATEADLAVEDELRRRLAAERPDDAVLGEERGHTGDGTRCWIVDAIDGTIDCRPFERVAPRRCPGTRTPALSLD